MRRASTSTAQAAATPQLGEIPKFLPTSYVRRQLGVSRPTLDALLNRGVLGQIHRFGSGKNAQRYVLEDAVKAFIERSGRAEENEALALRARASKLLRG